MKVKTETLKHLLESHVLSKRLNSCLLTLSFDHARFEFVFVLNFRKPPVCQDALGMESRAIPDGQISASSEWDSNHAAIQGRLNYKPSGSKQGAWSAKTNDANQWLQVDLGASYATVTRVATQGRLGADQWVTKYRLQYSNDGVNFQDYREQGQTVNEVNLHDLLIII